MAHLKLTKLVLAVVLAAALVLRTQVRDKKWSAIVLELLALRKMDSMSSMG
jgi:hypothetical protein